MKNAPNTPLKSLSQEQKIEYKDALKVLRFSVLTSEKGFSSTRFWNWEELSSGDTPLQIQKIEFSRYKGKTYITLHVINPFDPKEPGYEGVIIVHNSKANNLLRYLIKEELKLGI